jgi:leader peptidase (prepilin peptidase)/N-methyltransferase
VPLAVLIGFAGLLGLIIGSFLNVVILRVPEGRSVVHPPSSCPTCGAALAGRDNVPVASWLLLRGRSRCCGTPISRLYPLVEAGTGVAFGAATALAVRLDAPPRWWAVLPALLYLAAISIALAIIDIRLKRLPNAIVLPAYPVAVALLATPAVLAGDPGRMVRAVICGVAMWAFYFVLMMINPRGMGYGDVKLAGVLGLYLGWFGVGQAVVGTFAAFVLGGVLGLGLILFGRAGRKSHLPFGPFMLAAVWLALLVGGDLVGWYLDASGL